MGYIYTLTKIDNIKLPKPLTVLVCRSDSAVAEYTAEVVEHGVTGAGPDSTTAIESAIDLLRGVYFITRY